MGGGAELIKINASVRVVSEKKLNTEFFGEGIIRGGIRSEFPPEIREYVAKRA